MVVPVEPKTRIVSVSPHKCKGKAVELRFILQNDAVYLLIGYGIYSL